MPGQGGGFGLPGVGAVQKGIGQIGSFLHGLIPGSGGTQNPYTYNPTTTGPANVNPDPAYTSYEDAWNQWWANQGSSGAWPSQYYSAMYSTPTWLPSSLESSATAPSPSSLGFPQTGFDQLFASLFGSPSVPTGSSSNQPNQPGPSPSTPAAGAPAPGGGLNINAPNPLQPDASQSGWGTYQSMLQYGNPYGNPWGIPGLSGGSLGAGSQGGGGSSDNPTAVFAMLDSLLNRTS